MMILFVGPTLWGSSMPLPPGVMRCPPAAAGDVRRAIAARPQAIALIDGVFGTAPSVWHKEILDALDCGIPVLGAASLGALRAAELCRFGMEGVGRVFEACRDGQIVRDDAVLVAHAPAELGWRPLSVALVDAEAALQRAPLAVEDRAALLRVARRTPYAERTWPGMLAAIERGQRLGPLLRRHGFSQKRQDAEALLARLGQPIAAPMPQHPARLVRTPHYNRLCDRRCST